jgi:hypothetical protein
VNTERHSSTRWCCALALLAALAGCAAPDNRPEPVGRMLSADEGRARVARLIPDGVADRNGWATDIWAAVVALQVPPSVENVCAAIAVIGQESGFVVDPPVAGLEDDGRVTRLFDDLATRFRLPRVEAISWPGADGATVEGLLYYPLDYVAGRRVPLVAQTHGGPASSDRFGFGAWSSYTAVLAAHGAACTEFALGDARAVEIVHSRDGDGDPMYRMRLWLAESESLWLQAQAVHGETRVREQAERVRHFLGLDQVESR